MWSAVVDGENDKDVCSSVRAGVQDVRCVRSVWGVRGIRCGTVVRLIYMCTLAAVGIRVNYSA